MTWTIEADLPETRPGTAREQLQGVLDLFTNGRARIVDEAWEASPEEDTAAFFKQPLRVIKPETRRTPESAQQEDGRHLRLAASTR